MKKDLIKGAAFIKFDIHLEDKELINESITESSVSGTAQPPLIRSLFWET